MAKILKIKANKDGFRRAGFGFSSKNETILKAEDLTAEQIKALKSEPKLIVVEADDKAATPPAAPNGNENTDSTKDAAAFTGTAAAALAAENGLTAADVTGTAAEGKISKKDVEAAIAARKSAGQ